MDNRERPYGRSAIGVRIRLSKGDYRPTPSAALYAPPMTGKFEGEGRKCSNCTLWARKDQTCALMDPELEILEGHVCGYHVPGEPQDEREERADIDHVDPQHAGLIYIGKTGTKCGNCIAFKGGTCARVYQQGKPAKVHRDGCCALWDRPMVGKWETTPEGVDEMSPGQADAWQEAHLNAPEYPEPMTGRRSAVPSYLDKISENLCNKCNGIKGKMIGKASALPMIGKHCGCPIEHKDDFVQPSDPLKGRMKGDMEAREPKGAMGPAPMKKGFPLQIISLETEATKGSSDARPMIGDADYTPSQKNLTKEACRDCAHGHDSFVANDHGFMVTGLRCDALRGDPLVAKDARCELWTGKDLGKSAFVIPAERLIKKQTQAGPFFGPRGGMWADPKHTIPYRKPKRKRPGRHELKRRVLAKTRRRRPGNGKEVSLTPEELHVVLSSAKYALVSAGKNPRLEPGMTKEEERQRHTKLRDRLKKEGFTFTKVEGHYEGEEDSFLVMVHDANRDHIRQVGKEFNQDSIIYGEGGQQEMHFTTGEHASKNECHAGDGYERKPDADDFFTKFPHPDGSHTKFALNFDFDKFVPCKKSMIHTLRKAGPYFGPRGGKWADPQHTIPWKESKGRRHGKKESDQERLDRVKKLWIDKWVGKPGESAAAEGVLLKHYGEAVRHVLDGTPLSPEAEEHQVRNFGKNWREDAKLVYQDTQRKLRERGITKTKLFRGVSHKQTHSHSLPGGGADMELGVYALSSWTTNTEAAKFFAGWENPPPPSQWGRVVVSEIDAKHIFLDHRVEPRLHAAGEREVVLAPPIPPGDRISAKAFAKPDLPKLEQTISEPGQMRAAMREPVDFDIDGEHQMWLRKVRAERGSDRRHTLEKAMNGAGPQNYQQQSMPDFQFIYHQPETRETKERERKQHERRRRAMADRNKGTVGFHGEAPEPTLRAEPDDYVPATQYGERRMKDRAPTPRNIPERLFARMVGHAGDKPPPGYTKAPGSKKGAYRRKIGGKWSYWYPGQPWPKNADRSPSPRGESSAKEIADWHLERFGSPWAAMDEVERTFDLGRPHPKVLEVKKILQREIAKENKRRAFGLGPPVFKVEEARLKMRGMDALKLQNKVMETLDVGDEVSFEGVTSRYRDVHERHLPNFEPSSTPSLKVVKKGMHTIFFKTPTGETVLARRTVGKTRGGPTWRGERYNVWSLRKVDERGSFIDRIDEIHPRSEEATLKIRRLLGQEYGVADERSAKAAKEQEARDRQLKEYERRGIEERDKRLKMERKEHEATTQKTPGSPFKGKRDSARYDKGVSWTRGKLDDPASLLRVAARKAGVSGKVEGKTIPQLTKMFVEAGDPFWTGVALAAVGHMRTSTGKKKVEKQKSARNAHLALAKKIHKEEHGRATKGDQEQFERFAAGVAWAQKRGISSDAAKGIAWKKVAAPKRGWSRGKSEEQKRGHVYTEDPFWAGVYHHGMSG